MDCILFIYLSDNLFLCCAIDWIDLILKERFFLSPTVSFISTGKHSLFEIAYNLFVFLNDFGIVREKRASSLWHSQRWINPTSCSISATLNTKYDFCSGMWTAGLVSSKLATLFSPSSAKTKCSGFPAWKANSKKKRDLAKYQFVMLEHRLW